VAKALPDAWRLGHPSAPLWPIRTIYLAGRIGRKAWLVEPCAAALKGADLGRTAHGSGSRGALLLCPAGQALCLWPLERTIASYALDWSRRIHLWLTYSQDAEVPA